MDEELYREYFPTRFAFQLPQDFPRAKSIIIVAVPQPQLKVKFSWKGESHSFIIPPTYLRAPNKEIEEFLIDFLKPQGFKVAPSLLPLKLLAARCGLGSYGKNNILYVSGMGSFVRLMAFYSDFPCEKDNWQNPEMMKNCQNCLACFKACPTGAITSKDFLLRAERCLVYHNDREEDFPKWIDPSWHHCLVGCMFCQKACPENKKLLDWFEEKGEFFSEETELFLNRARLPSVGQVPLNQLPPQTIKKLEAIEVDRYYQVFCRNLSVLLNKPGV